MNSKKPPQPSPQAIEILSRMMVNRAKRLGHINPSQTLKDKPDVSGFENDKRPDIHK